MILKRISILNYKNLEQVEIGFSAKLNCFFGQNGMGKTNLLDAVYFLSFCKSSGNPIDSQNIRHEQDFFVIQGFYEASDGTPEEIYNEPHTVFVADFIGESNIIPSLMLKDRLVKILGVPFACVDEGFGQNKPVDVVIRPEDIDIVDVKDGKMTGEVLSVLFKGVHYEIMVETVPGTSVTVNMRVIRNHDVTSEDGSEKISANNFYVDLEDVENLDDKEIVALSNAQAWETESDEYISIANIEYELEAKEGQYPVTFSTANGTSIERTIFVVNQPFVKNEKANEGVMAFNFFKTVDEITESQALDTDLKTWANAQGWKLTDEDQSVDISVDYDFDPEEVTEGVYEITFSTTGREFKIHTTDYSEEGQEVGLTFFPEDIHVMPKVVF